jgi:hypothetical protein
MNHVENKIVQNRVEMWEKLMIQFGHQNQISKKSSKLKNLRQKKSAQFGNVCNSCMFLMFSNTEGNSLGTCMNFFSWKEKWVGARTLTLKGLWKLHNCREATLVAITWPLKVFLFFLRNNRGKRWGRKFVTLQIKC